MSRRFSWISLADEPPQAWDLRRAGWTMLPSVDGTVPCLLDWREATARTEPDTPTRLMAALGVADGGARADLLARGFGEALAQDIEVDELAMRIERMAESAAKLPRTVSAGPVALDIFHRDGAVAGRWLGLLPREFELLWHLADTPGRTVSRADLLSEVWRLQHDPGTNSLEVHVSRLRAKLNAAGVAALIETAAQGGYRLKS